MNVDVPENTKFHIVEMSDFASTKRILELVDV